MNWVVENGEWTKEIDDYIILIQKVVSDETYYRYWITCASSLKLIKTSDKFYSLSEVMEEADRIYGG